MTDTPRLIDRRSDAKKLVDLATWFDMFDRQGQGHNRGNDEVQQDLRRIAGRLRELDRKPRKRKKRK